MTYVAVLPSIHQPWTELSVASCRLADLVVVDNTVANRGVAASWNFGIQEMAARNADWLVVLSAAVRFGAPGGLDFIEALDQHPEALGVEGFNWHLIAFHRRTVAAVGVFDENFYPAYFEDNDYSRRVSIWLEERGQTCSQCDNCSTTDVSRHHHPECPDPHAREHDHPLWPRVAVDGTEAGNAHGVHLGGVKDNPQKMLDYYERKWGGPRSGETFNRPFGNPDNGLDYWPTP